jgi:hypothetical protein
MHQDGALHQQPLPPGLVTDRLSTLLRWPVWSSTCTLWSLVASLVSSSPSNDWFRAASASLSLSLEPSFACNALADPIWQRAMEEEYAALVTNNTWDMIPCPPGSNVMMGKWEFDHKFHVDGSLERYKARCVSLGFTQRPGIDYDETFGG